jgi:hypothetical protein
VSASTAPVGSASPLQFISAATFLEIIDGMNGAPHLSNAAFEPIVEVAGVVDFAGRDFPNGLSIERICFWHAVKMSNCSFGNRLFFKSCSFQGQLDLANTRLSGGTMFDDCTFQFGDVKFGQAALSLDDADITGAVTFCRTTVYGCVTARRLKLSGDLTFSACTIEGDSNTGSAVIDLTAGRITGAVRFESHAPAEIRSPSDLATAADRRSELPRRSVFIDRSRSESVALRNAEVTYIDLAWAYFVGGINLSDVDCFALTSEVNNFSCRPGDVEIWPGTSFGGAVVKGNLLLSSGDFGLIHLAGIIVEDSVILIDGHSGQIQIDDGIPRYQLQNPGARSEKHVLESEIGNFLMAKWVCRDFLEIHPRIVKGETNKWSIQGISIDSSEINGDLSFWPGKQAARMLRQYLDGHTPQSVYFAVNEENKLARPPNHFLNRWQRHLRITGDLDLHNCTIGGDIILTGVEVTELEDRRQGGRIVIRNSTVAGKVAFSSPISQLTEDDKPDGLLLLLARWFVVRHLLSQFLLGRIQEADCASSIADLMRMYPALARQIFRRQLLSDEIATAVPADWERLRPVLLSDEISEQQILEPIVKHPWLIRRIVPPDYARLLVDEPELAETLAKAVVTRDGLEAVRDQIVCEVVASAILKCENLPFEIVELAKNALTPFEIGHAFEPASCSKVDMNHLSAAKMDLSGLKIRMPTDKDEVPERRVNLHYAEIRERLDIFIRLEKKSIDDVWKQFDQILIPSQREKLPAVLAFARVREREVISASFDPKELEFFASVPRPQDDFARVEQSADIPGALDMPHAEIDELYLSDKSFRRADLKDNARDHGIVLDYAKINKLYVARGTAGSSEPRSSEQRMHNGFPVPMSLLNISVKGWFLEETLLPAHAYLDHEAATAEAYLDLLDNDTVFRMSAYLEIEKDLRDRGLDGQANQVFIAGRYRDMRIGFDDDGGRARPVAPTNAFGLQRLIGNILNRVAAMRDAIEQWLEELARWWRVWRPGDGRACRYSLLRYLAFRLTRPRREYVGFVLCLAWWLSVFYLVARAAFDIQSGAFDIGHLAFPLLTLATALALMRHAMRLFFDQLYWSILAYGTSPWRLVLAILILAGFSLTFVSGERENFEPTIAAEATDTQKRLLAAGTAPKGAAPGTHHAERKWDDSKKPEQEQWPFGERIWMTLRYHMPLVAAVVSDEWQPSDKPLKVLGLPTPAAASWWPRARDWFGIMLWTNWILWPFFLPYLIRKLIRYRADE